MWKSFNQTKLNEGQLESKQQMSQNWRPIRAMSM
jgi:hypothetical protein